MVCSGADGGNQEKKGNHGFAFGVTESIVAGICEGDVKIECVRARFIRIRIKREI